jgi:hypothetical protein
VTLKITSVPESYEMSWNSPRGGGNIDNPPFVIPVQVDRYLEPFIPMFTGYVLDCIEQKASRNDARALFKALMENDDRALAAVVQELANAVEYFVESQELPESRVEACIRNTVTVVVDAYMAMAINQYPDDFGPVIDREMVRDVQDYILALNKLKAEAQDFYQRGRSGRRDDYDNPQRGWQPNNRYQRGGGWQGNQQSNGYRTATEDDWPGNRSNVTSRHGGGNKGGQRHTIWDHHPEQRTTRASDKSFNNGAGTRLRRDHGQEDRSQNQARSRHVEKIVANQTTVDGKVFVPIVPNQEWPKVVNTSRIYDHVLLANGTQMRPAHLSDWVVSFNPDMPVIPWYDPSTHVLFHLKLPDGTVSATPTKRDKNMDYFEHELNPELRRIARANLEASGAPVAPAWNLVATLTPNPASPLATAGPINEDAVADTIKEVGLPSDYLIATSLSEGIKRACLRLKVDNNELFRKPFEMYIERAVLTTIVNPDFDLVLELSNLESFEKLHAMLMERSIVNEELATEIDQRVVQAVNQALQKHMGLKGWSISNFREDFGDLVAALEEDYGKLVVQKLQENAIEIISRFLAFYKPDELETARKSLGLEDKIPVLVWRERSSVTRMPFTSAQANIPTDTGVLVSIDENPEMYRTLESIFERAQDLRFTFHGRYLAFSDGVVYSLVRGYFNEQSILVFKANFEIQ